MQLSKFNVQVPIPERNEVFLMNTFSDAQLLVSPDVSGLLERVGRGESAFEGEERDTIESLVENGFVVGTGNEEEQQLQEFFTNLREDTEQFRVTIVTTLQCNFACDYCMQGDHGDHNLFAHKMSLETAGRVADWIEQRLDEVKPKKFVLTFFGGEPLLNIPVIYLIGQRANEACKKRGIPQLVSMITNGLLLTPEIVDRMLEFGLNGIKITLDGDKETHDRMRPLRGRQGTFDRIIANVRKVASKVPITIGGNFDESSADSYPALLDFLRAEPWTDQIAKINFKPIIKSSVASRMTTTATAGIIPLMAVATNGKPLNGACMTGAGAGSSASVGGSPCDTCNFVEEKVEFLRDETRKAGFDTLDGVHMGPCEIHRKNAQTVGVDGGLFACPGFGSEASLAIGHVDPIRHGLAPAIADFERLTARKDECEQCSFLPVCGGGCSVASYAEQGDLHAATCHKSGFEAALISLAHRTVAANLAN